MPKVLDPKNPTNPEHPKCICPKVWCNLEMLEGQIFVGSLLCGLLKKEKKMLRVFRLLRNKLYNVLSLYFNTLVMIIP
jgi:hypothetical protein